MFKQISKASQMALMAGAISMSAVFAQANYSTYGVGMNVQTGTVANGELHVQVANNLWTSTSGSGSATNTYTNSFSGWDCDSYAKAWLVTTVYGGSNLNTATINLSVNGNTIASPTVGNAGGVNDSNMYVYGSSVAGIWVIAVAVDTSYLNVGSSATNQVSVTVSNKTQGATALFDGRSYYQSLVTITQDSSLNNVLAYAFAAGGGDIGTSAGYTTSRTLDLGSLSTSNVTDADLYALYIYGDAGQNDKLLLNGTSLLGDDVATKNGTASYPADFVSADATSALQDGNNTLTFTVDPSDVAGGESSLRPELAVLGVTYSVPEPATVAVLAMGTGLLLATKRKRR